MWTIQEYRLPHDEPIGICGQLVFQASKVGGAQDIIHKAGHDAIDEFLKKSR